MMSGNRCHVARHQNRKTSRKRSVEPHEEVAEVQFQHQELGQALGLRLDMEVVEQERRQLQHCALRLRLVGERTVQPEQHECQEDRRMMQWTIHVIVRVRTRKLQPECVRSSLASISLDWFGLRNAGGHMFQNRNSWWVWIPCGWCRHC